MEYWSIEASDFITFKERNADLMPLFWGLSRFPWVAYILSRINQTTDSSGYPEFFPVNLGEM